MKWTGLNSLIIWLVVSHVYSQIPNPIAEKFIEYNLETDTLQVLTRLFVPENYDSLVKYPVVLSLHGGNSIGTDNYSQLLSEGATTWGEPDFQEDNPCFIFCPQSPSGDIGWKESSYKTGIIYLLDSLTQIFSIDIDRIYITGNSMGGFGTWNYLSGDPNRFAAAVPVCGGYEQDDSILVHKIMHIPVWNFHSNNDLLVNVEYSRSIFRQYQKFGITPLFTHKFYRKCYNLEKQTIEKYFTDYLDIIYTEYSGLGHLIAGVVYQNSLMKKWLFQQKRHSKNNIILDKEDIPLSVSEDQIFTFSTQEQVASISIWLGSIQSNDWTFIDSISSDVESYTFHSVDYQDHPYSRLKFVALDSNGFAIGKDYSDIFSINNSGNGRPYICLLEDPFLKLDYPVSDTCLLKFRLGDPDEDSLMVSFSFSYDNGRVFEYDINTFAAKTGIYTYKIPLTGLSYSDSTIIRAIASDGEFSEKVETLSFRNTRSFVPINDTIFLNSLIKKGVDVNSDSLINYEEAEVLFSLDICGQTQEDGQITSMSGIEAFINLDTLICSHHRISSLDVSNNTHLKYLDCEYNALGSLDISKNRNLVFLNCGENELTSLDVSNNKYLKVLRCGGNQLATLDISNNTANRYADIYLGIDNMPTINEICVWTFPFPIEGIYVDTSGSPNVCFEMDCNGTCDDVSEIDRYSMSGISIYPNPINHTLTIAAINPEHHSIEISSLNGQQLFSTEMEGTTHQIDLSSFQKGVYLITIRSKDFLVTRKIIKL